MDIFLTAGNLDWVWFWSDQPLTEPDSQNLSVY